MADTPLRDAPLRDAPLPAGELAAWLSETLAAHRVGEGASVPCDRCTACCAASQFVHLDPDDRAARANIPAALLFPAPGAPPGTLVMGYDAAGRCPMLGPSGCTIYDHRPRACRMFDCRVFAATGVAAQRPGIDAQVARWRFDATTSASTTARAAIDAAVRFVREKGDAFPGGPPRAPTAVALVALRAHAEFVDPPPRSDRETAAAILERLG